MTGPSLPGMEAENVCGDIAGVLLCVVPGLNCFGVIAKGGEQLRSLVCTLKLGDVNRGRDCARPATSTRARARCRPVSVRDGSGLVYVTFSGSPWRSRTTVVTRWRQGMTNSINSCLRRMDGFILLH